MNKDERLWFGEPPTASVAQWAEVYEMVSNLTTNLLGDDGEPIAGNELKMFVLEDLVQRCAAEAERRDPDITRRRLLTSLDNAQAQAEEFTD
jgi:hypothetical protein